MVLFVVAEGVDRAGKTSILMEARRMLLEDGEHCEYYAALKSDSMIGRFAKIFPSTYSLLGLVWYGDRTVVRPCLEAEQRKGIDDILLMDRWWYSVRAHHVLSRQEDYFAVEVCKRLSRPDILINVKVGLEERLSRLEKERSDSHDRLLKDPQLIVEYENRLQRMMAGHSCVQCIDTTGKSVQESAKELVDIIGKYRKMFV